MEVSPEMLLSSQPTGLSSPAEESHAAALHLHGHATMPWPSACRFYLAAGPFRQRPCRRRPPRRAALCPSPPRAAPQRLGGRSGWQRSHARPGGAAVGARGCGGARGSRPRGSGARGRAATELEGLVQQFARPEVRAHYHRYLDISGETRPTRGRPGAAVGVVEDGAPR